MSMFNTEMFINEIEKHECIWKTDAKEYSYKNVKAAAWNGIGEPCTMTGRSSTMMDKELKVSHSINCMPTLSFSVLFCIAKLLPINY